MNENVKFYLLVFEGNLKPIIEGPFASAYEAQVVASQGVLVLNRQFVVLSLTEYGKASVQSSARVLGWV